MMCNGTERTFHINTLEYLTCWNVMMSLAIGLLIMMLFDSSIRSCTSIALLGCLISLFHFCDWSYLIPSWTIIFFCYYKRDTKKMIVLFALASVTLQTLAYLKEFDSFALFSFSTVPFSLSYRSRCITDSAEMSGTKI